MQFNHYLKKCEIKKEMDTLISQSKDPENVNLKFFNKKEDTQ